MEPIFSGWSDFLANSQPVEGEVPAAYTAGPPKSGVAQKAKTA